MIMYLGSTEGKEGQRRFWGVRFWNLETSLIDSVKPLCEDLHNNKTFGVNHNISKCAAPT
jgi:hypothetical protein